MITEWREVKMDTSKANEADPLLRFRICMSGTSCAGWGLVMQVMSRRWTASRFAWKKGKRSPWSASQAAANPA